MLFRSISPVDRYGNDKADGLARACAEAIGPTPAQQEAYDGSLRRLAAVQTTQAKVLEAVMRADVGPMGAARDRRRRALADGNQGSGRTARVGAPPIGEKEYRTWGVHLITAHGAKGYRCVLCARRATGNTARHAMRRLPCLDRPGLTLSGMTNAQWERWNGAWVRRWTGLARGGPHDHDVVRYFATKWDGRWLCLRCGRHYVRRCDLVCGPCPGVTQNPRSAQALEDAIRGKPLQRQKVNSRAQYPSGANLRAACPRLPGFDGEALPDVPQIGRAHV